MTQIDPEIRRNEASARRLGEELADDGIVLLVDDEVRSLILDELDHARRAPAFEGRRPAYGSFVIPATRKLKEYDEEYDVVDLSALSLGDARGYADGRSAYLVRRPDAPPKLACFGRLMQMESELVRLQETTGAHIIQRTAFYEVPRLFTSGSVVTWTGRVWAARPTANAVLPALCAAAPALDVEVAANTLELAVHWLGPARAGATFVLCEREVPWETLDTATATRAPDLWLTNRRHFWAVYAALATHDLATIVSPDGRVLKIGVGLRTSPEAYATIPADRGMRHRSAQRFSYDHPDTALIVVSEDGPVTVFRRGEAIAAAGSTDDDPVEPPVRSRSSVAVSDA
jgi:Probable sensor domain DACNK/DisA bacterial checkpoint controller nucleotide-binding